VIGKEVEGTQVENDDVEWLGLERLSSTECKKMGWKRIILKDLNLTNVDGMTEEEAQRVSRAAFAFEQQCQLKMMDKN
jgi:hypothetical protein